jgi:hypothetical protein
VARVVVLILHPDPAPTAGPLERWLLAARRELAERHRLAFAEAGASVVRVVAGPRDDTPFGARLRSFVEAEDADGLVVLGSGSVPFATDADLRAFVEAAGSGRRDALTNNWYSSDIVAVGRAEDLAGVPDLPSDNALPRWLAEAAGFRVAVRGGVRLGFDLDVPLDILLAETRLSLTADVPAGIDLMPVRERLAEARDAAADAAAELVVAGRTSPATLHWLERASAARVRALIEERGLRSASPGANRRPPRSVLGRLLDREGPEALGELLAEFGDAAFVDSRVLIAHRYGLDERAWPLPEDRFASDLLLPDRVTHPWLRALTASASSAPIPVILGGHTLIGPGLRLALGTRRSGTALVHAAARRTA